MVVMTVVLRAELMDPRMVEKMAESWVDWRAGQTDDP